MNTNLTLLAEECDRHEFRIVATAETERGEGVAAGGLVAVERSAFPHDGRAFATLRWSFTEGGAAYLYSGHYDLTRAEALADLANRAGVTPVPGTADAAIQLDADGSGSPFGV